MIINKLNNKGGEMDKVIYSYTKADAVADGSQTEIDDVVYGLKHEQGFGCPLYLTSGVIEVLKVPEGAEGQDLTGRTWDLLTMAKIEAKRMAREQDHFGSFEALFVLKKVKRSLIEFFITFEASEGFTIMLPDEY